MEKDTYRRRTARPIMRRLRLASYLSLTRRIFLLKRYVRDVESLIECVHVHWDLCLLQCGTRKATVDMRALLVRLHFLLL
jgi:hypothetical protein